jgi:hypothetical protein
MQEVLIIFKSLSILNKVCFLPTHCSFCQPVALELGVPLENIFANQLLFGISGEYVGFDPTEPTSRSEGKAVAVQHIRHVWMQLLSLHLFLLGIWHIVDTVVHAEMQVQVSCYDWRWCN